MYGRRLKMGLIMLDCRVSSPGESWMALGKC